jgi:hypothetical protein
MYVNTELSINRQELIDIHDQLREIKVKTSGLTISDALALDKACDLIEEIVRRA